MQQSTVTKSWTWNT